MSRMTAPRPTSTSADPPRGCGPAWERPVARPARVLSCIAGLHTLRDRHAHQLERAARLELEHHVLAVELHRLRAQAALVGDHLAELAGDDAVEDFALARRQRSEALQVLAPRRVGG